MFTKINSWKDNSGGALLFSIVPAFVISATAATMVSYMLNHCQLMNSEVYRREAAYMVRAGFEYTYDCLYSGTISLNTQVTFPYDESVQILVTSPNPDPDIPGDHMIEVWKEY